MLTGRRTFDIAEGWGGVKPNGSHVNVVLARRGSPTAAAAIGMLAHPSPGHTPVLVCVGPEESQYEPVWPPTPMVNQDGKATSLADFRGKAVLITFVDTQCKDDCPIISHLFSEINQELAKDKKAYAGSDLITISTDPAHDTPAVLHAYGLKYLNGKAAGFSHWQFVHMTPANLKGLATAFGG